MMTFEEAMKYTVADIARGFVQHRDHIKKEDAAHAERMKPLKEQMEIFQKAMHAKLNEAGVTSMNTPSGTPYLTTIETVKMEDFEAFNAWVNEIQEPDFYVKAANKTKVLEWRDTHKALPPGVSTSAIVNLNFRT